MEKAIRIEHISKSFKAAHTVQALDDINLDVHAGEVFGLIGPDGAGKTTLFRILTTLILADEGSAYVAGHDVVKEYPAIRSKVGYMPGRFSLYQDLSVRENLQFFATIFHTSVEENYDLIKDIYVQIEPFKRRRAGALSGGMKQKLALCCALIHRPDILFLDEPTTGVDAVSRKEFWEMLLRLKERGITIFVSTPYMDEASKCDRIALVQDGRILSVDSPQGMLEAYGHELWGVQTADMYRAFQDLSGRTDVLSCHTFGVRHHVRFQDLNMPGDLEQYLTDRGHQHVLVQRIPPTIEDCFMDLMQSN